jgi:hypothetical protein
VHRQKCAAAEHRQRLQCIRGTEMNVAPRRMKCPTSSMTRSNGPSARAPPDIRW